MNTATVNGQTFRLGRVRPVARCPRLRLSNYLTRSLPTPPATVDYVSKAANVIKQVYCNNRLGCCVISGLAHLKGILQANADATPHIYSDAEIESLYSAIGGYVPGDESTDNGCNEQDALNYFQAHGEILGYAAIDPNNQTEMMTGLWLMEHLLFGAEIPDAWRNISGNGFFWTPGQPNPKNGHCFLAASGNNSGLGVATWGMYGTITWPAVKTVVTRQYGGEVYVALSLDAINKATQKAPNGFDAPALISDIDALGAHVPPPNPPPPPPNPPPGPPPLPGNYTIITTCTKDPGLVTSIR